MTFSKGFLLTTVLILVTVGSFFAQDINQPTYLPLWKIGQSWTYKNLYALPVHKWLNLKSSEIQKVRYTVIGTRPLDSVYEYILFTEYFLKNGEIIPDFQYAPISNLSITPFEGPDSSYLDFPLYVGKKWKIMLPSISYLGNSQEIKKIKRIFPITADVQSTETTVTPAGTFVSYKINYEQRDGAVFSLWYSPKVENIVKGRQASSVLVNFSTIPSNKLKEKILGLVEKMPKVLSKQRSYVVLSLYKYKLINLDEALKLIHDSQK